MKEKNGVFWQRIATISRSSPELQIQDLQIQGRKNQSPKLSFRILVHTASNMFFRPGHNYSAQLPIKLIFFSRVGNNKTVWQGQNRVCGAKFTPVVPTQRGAQGPVKKVAKQHFGAQKKGSGCRGVGDPGCESESWHVFPQHRTIALFSLSMFFNKGFNSTIAGKKHNYLQSCQVECKLPNQSELVKLGSKKT